MEIEADDPRSQVETITYTRSIVPGSVEDVKLSFRRTVIRPDELEFTLRRPSGEPWFVDSVTLRGHQVLKNGKTGTPRHEDRLTSWPGTDWRDFPADVVEYVEIILAGVEQRVDVR